MALKSLSKEFILTMHAQSHANSLLRNEEKPSVHRQQQQTDPDATGDNMATEIN